MRCPPARLVSFFGPKQSATFDLSDPRLITRILELFVEVLPFAGALAHTTETRDAACSLAMVDQLLISTDVCGPQHRKQATLPPWR